MTSVDAVHSAGGFARRSVTDDEAALSSLVAEAQVTIIDPRPYMTYRPFLPEVMADSIESRHAVVPLRRHLRQILGGWELGGVVVL